MKITTIPRKHIPKKKKVHFKEENDPLTKRKDPARIPTPTLKNDPRRQSIIINSKPSRRKIKTSFTPSGPVRATNSTRNKN